MSFDAVIIGAGISGLTCANYLQRHQKSYIIVDADKRIGGRIKTDTVNGFKLDHGFQVLQTGYPEARRTLDYKALNLMKFPAGVAVRSNGKFHMIADPRYHFRHLYSTISSPIGTFKDRLLMLRLARTVSSCPFAELFSQPEEKTIDFLSHYGFSEGFINRFFVPFFAGACLDREITASSRVLKYIFRVFAEGDAALPALGMAEIPRQLATNLPEDCVRLQSRVEKIDNDGVLLASGEKIQADAVVIATSAPAERQLLGIEQEGGSVGESCLYFTGEWLPPFNEPFLILNGEGTGPINNIAFPSLVAPEYATDGRTLIAVVVLGDEYCKNPELQKLVRDQCRKWFGGAVDDWEHLHTYEINHALPLQEPPTQDPYRQPALVSGNTYRCGEIGTLPGTQWALLAGRLTAETMLRG
ncbi:MAG: NAD(P)/FAD-dependent oxidoreductase [Desulfocapsaceae bacterium]|nr:NAD(P)/FAD-dependent oxidoreductase [Desulfocapsaceae bacterium]